MLQAFIITLREGVEAALIVGITLAYLTKIGRADLRKTVYAALAAAFLGSIGVAIVISRTHLNEDAFEGWIMLVAAFFVVTRPSTAFFGLGRCRNGEKSPARGVSYSRKKPSTLRRLNMRSAIGS